MSLNVPCECGSRTPVDASQAGSMVACRCGKRVAVPALSVLRRSGGQGEAPTSALQRVRDLIASGKLPSNTLCPLSGLDADLTAYFRVDCESMWTRRGTDEAWQLVYFFLFGWVGLLVSPSFKRPAEVLGHDISVEVPLRINQRASAWVRGMKRRELRRLLAKIPPYRTLLHEYPKAHIEIVGGVT